MTDIHPKIGVVGISGKWSSEALADAVAAKTGFRLLIDMSRVEASLAQGCVHFDGHDLTALDGIIIKKISEVYAPDVLDRLELLRFVASTGVSVFSDPAAVIRLINRLSCTITLRAGGITLPDTVLTEDIGCAIRAVERFGSAVLKPLYSTKARGMKMVHTDDTGWHATMAEFGRTNRLFYIQKRVEIPGQDLGVMFIGGKYLATYARVGNELSWNTTVNSGGHYAPHQPSRAVLEIAGRAEQLFGLDFTCVDVVETADGPRVFEVSAFGGFRGLQDAHGIDAADLYVTHALDKLACRSEGRRA